MRKLTLDDITKIVNVKTDTVVVSYLEYVISPPSGNNLAEVGLKVSEKTLTLDKSYQKGMEQQILNTFINKLKVKEEKETVERFIIDIKDYHHIKPEEYRYAMSRPLLASNKVAIDGRIGPANHIVVDPQYINIIDQSMPNNFTYLSHKGLGDKILVFRKPEKEHAGFIFAHNDDNYSFEEVGDWNPQYQVVKIKCDRRIREKKLKRILNDK